MPTTIYAGKSVTVNDEGFFEQPDEWTEEMASEIARGEGIDALTEDHWRVDQIHALRIRREGHGAYGAGVGQDLWGHGEGAVPAVPQGSGQGGGQDRRDPQAPWLHLTSGHRPTGRRRLMKGNTP